MNVNSGPERVLNGGSLLGLLWRAEGEAERRNVLQRWSEALDVALAAKGSSAVDLLPHNAVTTTDGVIHFVDSKWSIEGFDRAAIAGRAALTAAVWIGTNDSVTRWPAVTVGDLAKYFGSLLGLTADDGWLRGVIEREAGLQASISIPTVDDDNLHTQTNRIVNSLHILCDTRLPYFAGEAPSALHAHIDELAAYAAEQEAGRVAAEAELAALQQTKLFRMTRTPRRLYDRLRRG
jgi:hypothetical protein